VGKKIKTDFAKILIEEYGLFLSANDLARLFKYSSGEAVRKAEKDGRLPVTLRRFPDRGGLYVPVHEVAEVVKRMSEDKS
jgi:hypothetical protein